MSLQQIKARGTVHRLCRTWSGVQHAISLYPKIEEEVVELLVQGEISDQSIINTILGCVIEEKLQEKDKSGTGKNMNKENKLRMHDQLKDDQKKPVFIHPYITESGNFAIELRDSERKYIATLFVISLSSGTLNRGTIPPSAHSEYDLSAFRFDESGKIIIG